MLTPAKHQEILQEWMTNLYPLTYILYNSLTTETHGNRLCCENLPPYVP
jgi:hypothetical protein